MNIIGANKAAGERLPIPDRKPLAGMINHANSAVWAGALTWHAGGGGYWQTPTFPQLQQPRNLFKYLELFMFLSDYPAISNCTSFYYTHTGIAVPAVPTFEEVRPWMISNHFSDLGDSLYIPDDPAQLEYKQAAKGRTLTQGVPVTGYPMLCWVETQGYLNGAVLAEAYVEWWFLANGVVVNGPGPWFIDPTTGSGVAAVILDEQYYTQAMADGGNVIRDAYGALNDTDVPIVGLYRVVTVDYSKSAMKEGAPIGAPKRFQR
jgi:hypothetical protein